MAARKTDVEDPADLAQAYREIAKGEQTAAALEANLTNLEGKLDAMLAALEGGAAAASDKTGDDAKGKTDTTKEGQESKKE